MKKLLTALSAVVAFSAPALAADMAPRAYTKAPAPMAVANWTGFYVFGGGGGGLWSADENVQVTGVGTPLTVNQRQGGSGWYGTVGAGYDWQATPSWVVGVFADGQFGSIKGTLADPFAAINSSVKLETSWAAGLRIGYLVAPNVLSYFNGGYTGSHWSGSAFTTLAGLPTAVHTDSFNRNGWFVGGGVEHNLNFFGVTAPGWFMKTEYRSAYYDNKAVTELANGTNLPVGRDVNFKPWVQTISTSLVYRFNWSGPAVSKY